MKRRNYYHSRLAGNFVMLKVLLLAVCITNCFAQCNPQQKTTQPAVPVDSVYTYRTASADGIGKFYFGREIAHVMSASGSAWLEREERQKEENADLAIEKIILPSNGAIADIGAGTGYYSFKLSKKVPQGKVYAVEIQDEMIRQLKEKQLQLKDSVVKITKGTEQSPNLADNSIDLAIMVDVYHELEFPAEVLQALRKCLKSDGKILLIEYRGEDPTVPIKELHKTKVAQLNREMGANGFKLNYKGDFLPIQHFLMYVKK